MKSMVFATLIQDKFNEAGIEIHSPHYTSLLRQPHRDSQRIHSEGLQGTLPWDSGSQRAGSISGRTAWTRLFEKPLDRFLRPHSSLVNPQTLAPKFARRDT